MKKANKCFLTVLLLVVVPVVLLAHDEFYDVDTENDQLVEMTASRSEIEGGQKNPVRWIDYYSPNREKVPLQYANTLGITTLTSDQVTNAWDAAFNTWNNTVGNEETPPFEKVDFNGVQITISNNDQNFENPSSSGGVTAIAVVTEGNQYNIVTSCTSGNCETDNTTTGILINNTDEFLTYFIWRWSSTPEGDPFSGRDGVDMQTIALHEMGHVLGLNHCSYENAVMYDSTPANASKRIIQVPDGIGFTNLYLLTPFSGYLPLRNHANESTAMKTSEIPEEKGSTSNNLFGVIVLLISLGLIAFKSK